MTINPLVKMKADFSDLSNTDAMSCDFVSQQRGGWVVLGFVEPRMENDGGELDRIRTKKDQKQTSK
jgi:hypothetical protein